MNDEVTPILILVSVPVLVEYGNKFCFVKQNDSNKYCLPYGFVGEREHLFDTAIRVLKEKTNIKLSEKSWNSSFNAPPIVFDNNVDDSLRVIKHVCIFNITIAMNCIGEKPKDSEDLKWITLEEMLNRKDDFDDECFQMVYNVLKGRNYNGIL
jgi:ADP-ribose pyrophosphatase YjhB (NUDIX family)